MSGIIRSGWQDGATARQVLTWGTKTEDETSFTFLHYNIYSPSVPGRKSGSKQFIGTSDRKPPAVVKVGNSFYMLYLESHSSVIENTYLVKVASSGSWGDLNAAYAISQEAIDNFPYELEEIPAGGPPAGLIRLVSGAILAAFYSPTLDVDKVNYQFHYRNPAGVWQTPVTFSLPKVASENTEQANALIQQADGSIYFFRHLTDDTAIGMIKLVEAAGTVAVSTSSSTYIAAGDTYPPQTTAIHLQASADPTRGGIVLVYPTSTDSFTFPNAAIGTRLALCFIPSSGDKTFATMTGKYVQDTQDFVVGADSTVTAVWIAAPTLDAAGAATAVQVGIYAGGTWRFTDTGISAALYPVRDDFGGPYAAGLCSGFGYLDADTMRFIPFTNYQTPGAIKLVSLTSAGVSGQANILRMALDSAGNVIVVGKVFGTVDFSILNYPIPPISSSGTHDSDGFMAKYDSAGHPLWAIRLGNTLWIDEVLGVTVDGSDNIIITGNFSTTVDFGAKADGTHVILTAYPMPPQGLYEQPDIFVAKYDNANPPNLIWARNFGRYGSEGGVSVDTDSNDDVLVLGRFSTSNVDFGNVGQPMVLSTTGNNDVLVMKMAAADGATQWVKKWGGTGNETVNQLVVDSADDLFIIGGLPANVTSNIGSGTIPAVAYVRMFVAKYSGVDGSPLLGNWPKVFGNGITSSAIGIAIDPSTGNIVITGGMEGEMDFGGGPIQVAGLPTGSAFFLAAYSAAGNYLWAQAFGDGVFSTTIQGRAIDIDENGNIAVVGVAQLMPYMGNVVFTSNGELRHGWWVGTGQGYFLAYFNSAGVIQWGAVTTVGNASTGNGVAFDAGNHIWAAGFAAGPVNFGGGFVSTAPPSYNASFIAKYAR